MAAARARALGNCLCAKLRLTEFPAISYFSLCEYWTSSFVQIGPTEIQIVCYGICLCLFALLVFEVCVGQKERGQKQTENGRERERERERDKQTNQNPSNNRK